MPTYKLSPYTVRHRESGDPSEWWDLSNLEPEHESLTHDDVLDLWEDFLGNYTDHTEKYLEDERTFTVREFTRAGNTIEGVFIGGNFGRGADHYNVNDDERTEGARGPGDAVETPYYFLFHVPDSAPEKALFILEMVGTGSVKGLFDEEYADMWSEDTYTEVDSEMAPELVEQVRSAQELVSLELEKTEQSSALHQRLGRIYDSSGSPAKEKLEIASSSGRDLSLNVDEFLDVFGNSERSSYRVNGVDYNEAKLSIKRDGSTKTLKLFQDDVRMERVVDPERDNVDLDNQMNPVPSSISPVAREFANDIFSRWGVQSIPEQTLL